jgi:hypothetical protein
LSKLTPRQLLAFDAGGAAVTAVMTALVLPRVVGPLGLPTWFFSSFGAAAAGLCVFSTVSALGRWHRASLKLVALGNFTYLVASVLVTVVSWATVSPLWLVYLAGECAVLVLLARIEWRAANARP